MVMSNLLLESLKRFEIDRTILTCQIRAILINGQKDSKKLNVENLKTLWVIFKWAKNP